MRGRTFTAVLGAMLALGLSCEKAPCEPPYSCPLADTDGGVVTVSCIAPSDGAPECTGTCNAWISENCPNVRFLY